MFVRFTHNRLAMQLASVGLITLLTGATSVAQALPGEVLSEQKISAAVGGLVGPLADGDAFGSSATGIGDLDGDGNVDMALGASLDDAGAVDAGAVYILFLNADGTVKAEQKISDTSGGFTGGLEAGDQFGSAVSGIGDLDGDGATELAVGARFDDDGFLDRGAVWILFLNSDGTVKRHEKVSFVFGGVRPGLVDGDQFGAVTAIGDLDGDGITELAVGAPGDATGGADAGAVWILFMLPDGSVHDLQEIDGFSGNFGGHLLARDAFGTATAKLGDLDGDGVADVAVSAASDQDGGPGRGAVWILFLNDDGTVKASQKISSTQGAFTGVLDDGDSFGSDLEGVGDLDGDGVADLAVGAVGDDDGGIDRGAVWVLFLNADGTVKAHQKIADMTGGFAGGLDDADSLSGIGAIGDLDGDGISELVATAVGDDDGGTERGAAYVLFMGGSAIVCGNAFADPVEECDDGNLLDFDGCTATCENEDSIEFFGAAASAGLLSVTVDSVVIDLALVVGDTPNQIAQLLVTAINGDSALSAVGTTAQAVTAKVFTNGTFTSAVSGVSGTSASFDPGRVLAEQKISDTQGGFTGGLDDNDRFGAVAATLGDVDGDGIADLAAGATFDSDGGPGRGALWILFLNADGSVKGQQKINDLEGGFIGLLEDGDGFGSAAAPLGDLDGDGIVDVAVGARDDDDGGGGRGAVWILFLNADGTVKSHQKISSTEGGFTGVLDNFDFFGVATASLGDLDGDGVVDIAVGAFNDDDGAVQSGAVWILFLNTNGTVKGHQKISNTQGGFGGMVGQNDFFGTAVASLGDLDNDGVIDLAVGTARDDDGGPARGAVWILFLNADGTVKAEQKISDTAGGFTGRLDNEDNFGVSTAAVGDLNADGVPDVAVGARDDDDGFSQAGGMWILFLNADGTVNGYQKVSDAQGGLVGELDLGDAFGVSTAALGDLNGDGSTELAVGAFMDDDGGESRGAVWILSLDGAKFAVCADEEVFFPETCDDGNSTSGDGCFSTCQIEDELMLSGTAAGGSLEVIVSGVSVVVATTAGESAMRVVTNLSTALNTDPALQSVDVSSVDLLERLVTNGTIDSIANSDAGLTIVPEPGFGFMLSMGLLAIARLGRRSNQSFNQSSNPSSNQS